MAFKTVTCKNCGDAFEARVVSTAPWRGQYCCLKCFHEHNRKYRIDDMTCPCCGKTFTPSNTQARALSIGRQKVAYCSVACYRRHRKTKYNGDGNPNWKGGIVESRGYRYVRMERHDIAPYFPEHQIVAEEKIGRCLCANEVVHHENGDKMDNRPENLTVMTRSEHMRLHATKGEGGSNK